MPKYIHENRLTAASSQSVLWISGANMFLCVRKALRVSEAVDAARAGVVTADSIRTHFGFDDDECCGRCAEEIDDLAAAECGVQTRFVRGRSGTGDAGELLAFIQGWAGEREVESFIERSRRNKRKLAQEGIFANGDCRGVYGYDYISATKERVVSEPEAQIVIEIFERVEAGESLNSIAVDFNDRGVPAKRGGTWDGVAIKNILRRSSYFGLDFCGRTRVRNGIRTPAPREEKVNRRAVWAHRSRPSAGIDSRSPGRGCAGRRFHGQTRPQPAGPPSPLPPRPGCTG